MNILIVDDEEDILEEIKSLAVQCTTFANNVFSTKDSTEALNIIENQKIDILVSDIRMPVENRNSATAISRRVLRL